MSKVMIGAVKKRIGTAGEIYEANGSKYYSIPFTVKNTQWTVLFVWGKINYVSIRKVSNNPMGYAIGKEFKNIDQALETYKNPEMKNQLIQSEFRAKKLGYKSK
jgi:hypothetical protein